MLHKIKPDKAKAEGTIGKALRVLDIVESFQKPIRFNAILENSPYPKPTTYRLLQSLVEQDLLTLDEDGYYNLGARLIRLAYSAWQNASIAPIAAPFLNELSRKTGQTVHLATLDNGQVLYLDKRNAAKPISMFSNAGKIGPAYCTGVGKAMLAHLDHDEQNKLLAQQSYFAHTQHSHTSAESLSQELAEIRAEGVSYDREEHEPNIICIAVPILAPSGQVLGGMSITSSTTLTSLEELSQYKNELQSSAKQIGESAANWLLPKMGG